MRVKHNKLNKFRNAIKKGDEIKDTLAMLHAVCKMIHYKNNNGQM
jgi:hypothetical protein